MSDSDFSYGSPLKVLEKQNKDKKAGYSSAAADLARLDINTDAPSIPIRFGMFNDRSSISDEQDFFCISLADFFVGDSSDEEFDSSIHTAIKQTYDSVYGTQYYDSQEESRSAAQDPHLVEGQISHFAELVSQMKKQRLYDIRLSEDPTSLDNDPPTPQSTTITKIDPLHDNLVSRTLLREDVLPPGFNNLDPFDTIRKLYDNVVSPEFSTAKEKYLATIRKPADAAASYGTCFEELSDQELGQLYRVLYYVENESNIPTHLAAEIKYVYIPSGGGKTTLVQQAVTLVDRLYDVDEFISHHRQPFELFCRLRDKYGWRELFSQWFKYAVHNFADKLRGKIFLCNHPNQIPNYMRLGYNELVIIPAEWNFGLRWFDDNIMSLLGVIGKKKVIGRYDSYESIIRARFPMRRSVSFKE